ncbi:MAG: hypothetical protein EPN60_00610 [Nevskiaceae bacterium]|nr:MAG: hypothetical protein EPO48_00625 [Nevskiaceae bacterium]TAM33776.1 MAG: hypothetical protein EPN60_00610 [Nevskiaceae bacterium]
MLILDLKTVPDPAAAKRLLALEPFSDAEAVLALTTLRVARQQPAGQPPPLRKVAAAVLLQAGPEQFELHEFNSSGGEPALLSALEQAVAAAAEPLWSWDAEAQIRSLLLARALAGDLALPRLLAQGGPRSLVEQFGFAPGLASLWELAAVHDLPHDLGLREAECEQALAAGDRARLLAGSGADALIAYLLSLALEHSTGLRTAESLLAERRRVAGWLERQTAPHWRAFRSRWSP